MAEWIVAGSGGSFHIKLEVMKNGVDRRRLEAKPLAVIAAGVLLGAMVGVPCLWAQYPGSPVKKPVVSRDQKLRSTAVLEWVGEPGKPSASRIVPVAVWDGERYQDGGLYLAQPAPLAVEDGTEYELEHAGVPQGTFVIFRAGQVDRNWFGYGMWHPAVAKKASKSRPSKTPPQVVTEVGGERPSLSDRPKGDKGSNSGSRNGSDKSSASGDGGKAAPTPGAQPDTVDPDRPTLHKRGAAGVGDQSDSSGAGGSSNADAKDGGRDSADGSEDPDPDRPTLHKRGVTITAAAKASAGNGDRGAGELGTAERDPDRPDLHRGRPGAGDPSLMASKLTGMPADLQQMAAISDSNRTDDHPFVFQWANPEDALRMKAGLESLARKAVAGATAKNVTGTVTNGAARTGAVTNSEGKVAAKPGRARTAAGCASAVRARAAAKAGIGSGAGVVLSDEVFSAFELSYSGAATLVLTAHAGGGDAPKDVTIIAQPDFYGVAHVLLQSVADDAQLDMTPRMRLVDAADTDGDNRAELIFELRGASDRQFAIYKIAGGHAEQVFATGSLPLGTRRN